MNRINKNKTFVIATIGVALSAIAQYFILCIMKHNTTIEQTFGLFIFDLLLCLILDAIKKQIYYTKP